MNPLIKKFGKEKRWVSWKLVNKDGGPTKIPVSLKGSLASSTDSSTWSSYDEITKKHKNVGIVFTPDQTLLGIDIDKCLVDNKIVHEQKEIIADLILESDTYTEISPSGTGLHIFLEISDGGIELSSHKKAPFEIYSSGRYFTVTLNTYGESKPVRKVTQEEANRLLSIIGYPWSKVEVSLSSPSPVSLDDSEVLRRMFTSKNGKQIESTYNGNTLKFNSDESLADASLLSHLAFWTGKNPDQMERLWLESPLGKREKTQKRKDYRTRSITNAISKCAKIYELSKKPISEETPIDFLKTTKFTKDGPVECIIQNTENICRVLRHDLKFKGRFRYDIFRNTMEIYSNVWRLQEMNDCVAIQTQLSILYPHFTKVGKEMVADAMILISKENTFDSAKDYIESISWDATPRLDTWLCCTYGVTDDVYHRAVGSNWIKGLVKRIINPGCKFDYVLVLEGEQGTRKSTSLSILGGQWHVETTMSTDSKDFFMQFQGKAIVEFSEGETLSRTEVKRMKAIITMQTDKYRPPYERLSQDFPRRCVFAMTTNQTEYLKDETGNRRWLPVTLALPEANIEWLASNRDQLLAEAYYRLTTLKESVHEFPKEETLQAQAARRIHDPNTDKIVEWYMNSLTNEQRELGVTTIQVYDQVINKGNSPRPIDRLHEMIIGTVFKETLRLQKRRIAMNGIQTNRYFNQGLVVAKDELDIKTW